MNYSLGLDIGTTSIKVVLLTENKDIIYKKYLNHYGKLNEVLQGILAEILTKFSKQKFCCMFTGTNAALFIDKSHIEHDIPCIHKGLLRLCPNANSVIDMGAQNARILSNLHENVPPQFAVNGNCAGGTGSFFEDQMNRLGLKIEDYSAIVEKAQSIPSLSGRCSVFAKTDIIHRQQEGYSTCDILLGLCYATIRNFKATTVKNLIVKKPLALSGGIIKNAGVIRAIKEIFELREDECFCEPDYIYMQALGIALIALERQDFILLEDFMKIVHKHLNAKNNNIEVVRLLPLNPHKTKHKDPICFKILEPTHCSLGIDIGSTSTNLVIIDNNNNIIDFQYLRTQGDPQRVVREGLLSIKNRFGELIIIKSVGVTGSGRYLIGKMVGADSIKDEITAQAKAAIYTNPDVDTVFEIGGQDSKYIAIKKNAVSDFQMNKICAAGTGSFIEEQASRLNIPIEDYGSIALSSKSPINLGERCTVFIEDNIATSIAKGAQTPDILAGLCYSVIKNYLFKVVGNKAIGENIVLQGGVCYNSAIVAAFKSIYGDKVRVNPYFSISGAFGVAVIASEEIQGKTTYFRGFELLGSNDEKSEKKSEIVEHNTIFYEKSKALFLSNYTDKLDPNKKTIGVPYVLFIHKLFPMIRTFFEKLGFNILLSSPTNAKTIEQSQKYAQAETCYPVKLIYGHMAELIEKNVDYIFLPNVHTMKHKCTKVYHNYGCVYMQTAPRLVFDSLTMNKKGIKLLNPIFSLDFGAKSMASALIGVGISLGKSKLACIKALFLGGLAIKKYTKQMEKRGKTLLSNLKSDEKALVIVTRAYGIEDSILNMGIPQELLKRGYKVITLAHLPAHNMDISHEYENLYWPFGQHIISGAKLIANHPNLYAIYLTNHGCAPDTMLSHLFSKEMGDKPYLNIEVDEHFSKVGVITRIEAFLNSLELRKSTSVKIDYFKNLPMRKISIRKSANKNKPLLLPYLYPYSEIMVDMLNKNGYIARSLPKTDAESLAIGTSKTISKEYLSFVALVGDILKQANLKQDVQVLSLQNEGSEADGIYARVIYDMLPENSNLELVSPMLETLPFSSPNCDNIFLALLAGDIIMTAPQDKRQLMMEKVNALDFININSLLEIINISTFTKELRISLIGEPSILFNPYLNQELFQKLEQENTLFSYMPMSEYCLYAWSKRAESDDYRKIDLYESQMMQISQALGTASPFALKFSELMKVNKKGFSHISGGNAAYRFARKSQYHNSNAIIEVSSLYENTQTILSFLKPNTDLPTLSLGFEASHSISLEERLKSFLYYLVYAEKI